VTDAQLLPVIWVLASMVLAVLATLAFSPARAAHFRLTPGGRLNTQVGRLAYYVGLPYIALLTRALSPLDLGLAGNSGPIVGWSSVDWLRNLGAAFVVGVLALVPIVLAARRLARTAQPLGVDERSTGAILLEAAYAEIHWAFYRAAPLVILGDVYWATVIGLGLIGVEVLVTLVRNGLGPQPEEYQAWLGQALLLAMSAAVFIATRNVWLALLLHIAVELAIKLGSAHLAVRPLSRSKANL
jgi:hypothetical protein